MAEYTDAAREIVDLLEDLKKIPRSGSPAYKVISKHWQVDENSTAFLELLGIVSSRIHNFKIFVEGVEDPYVTHRLRTKLLGSIQQIAWAFVPGRLAGPWASILDENITEETIGNVEFFSPIAGKHRPLRRLREEERVDILGRIATLSEEMRRDEELDPWIKQVIIDGLSRSRYTLDYLRVFGHDKAIDEIAYAFQRFSSLYASADESKSGKGSKEKIFAAINVLMFAANMFCVLDQGLTAFDRYKGWLIAPIAQAQLAPPETQKLLEGPKALLTEDDGLSEL